MPPGTIPEIQYFIASHTLLHPLRARIINSSFLSYLMPNDKLFKAAADTSQLEVSFPSHSHYRMELLHCVQRSAAIYLTQEIQRCKCRNWFCLPFPPAFFSPAAAVRRKLSGKFLITPPHSRPDAEITSAITFALKNSYNYSRDWVIENKNRII